MTMNLYWEPRERDANDLSDKLKFILRQRYGEPVDAIFNRSDIPYLRGLLDAGVKDAQQVIDAIDRHEEIHIFER